MNYNMTFGAFRALVAPGVRVSICSQETMQFRNYLKISDVPESYDGLWLYGFSKCDSQFSDTAVGGPGVNALPSREDRKAGTCSIKSCLEIMVSKTPRWEDAEAWTKTPIPFGVIRRFSQLLDPVSVVVEETGQRDPLRRIEEVPDRYDGCAFRCVGLVEVNLIKEADAQPDACFAGHFRIAARRRDTDDCQEMVVSEAPVECGM